ncbi:LysR family transcriptional regulator [Bordetella trematum]|uniref:LysR family transcriptional regulator n=1 Tax=Bordetella trematum TaxID=123899 RepID=UPI00398A32F5
MDLRQLKYFVVLAEELHFRRAAARLAISQPPLSSAIKQLEEELGTPLFVRTTKTVALTYAGQAFYPEALKVMAQLQSACAITREVGAGKRGYLRIGFVGGMLLRGLPELVQTYAAINPEVIVSLREMSSAEQIKAIAHGQMAAGFLHAGVLPPQLDGRVIRHEPFVACVPQNHPLARRSRIELQQLAEEDMVLFARDASPAYYDTVVALCMEAGFSPRVRHEVTHWLTALLLISRGSGVAIIPDAYVRSGLAGVQYLHIHAAKPRSLAHFAWKRSAQDPLLHDFSDYVRRHYEGQSDTVRPTH